MINEFDIKARNYSESNFFTQCSRVVAHYLSKIISEPKQMTALEYGIGNSLISFMMKDRLADIVMIDGSQSMVDLAQDRINREGIINLWPLCIDLEREYFMGEFDVIYNLMLSQYVNNLDCILKKFYSFLRPGGYVAIADLHQKNESFQEDNIGINAEELIAATIRSKFNRIKQHNCLTIELECESGHEEYKMFLLIAQK